VTIVIESTANPGRGHLPPAVINPICTTAVDQ
jgi:hypothetical protein